MQQLLLQEGLVPGKVAIRRTLKVERDYEPSRVWRQAMASSYERLIPLVRLSLQHERNADLCEEVRRIRGSESSSGGAR